MNNFQTLSQTTAGSTILGDSSTTNNVPNFSQLTAGPTITPESNTNTTTTIIDEPSTSHKHNSNQPTQSTPPQQKQQQRTSPAVKKDTKLKSPTNSPIIPTIKNKSLKTSSTTSPNTTHNTTPSNTLTSSNSPPSPPTPPNPSLAQYFNSIPNITPITIQHIALATDNLFVNRVTAAITSRYLLISRIPFSYTLQTIQEELTIIATTLGQDIDIDEFRQRFNEQTKAHIYMKDKSDRLSILVKLTNTRQFCATGNFGTPLLPIFFFTTKATNLYKSNGTLLRLTVQALPLDEIHYIHDLHEVCCIRCLPDNGQSIAALLPILLKDLYQSIDPSIPLLPLLLSTPDWRAAKIFLDEVFLRIYTTSPNLVPELHASLSLQPTPIHHRALSWSGQIAKAHINYKYSPTNNTSLIYLPTTLEFPSVTSGTFQQLYPILQSYILSEVSYGYIVYGRIDSPYLQNPSNAIVLVSATSGDLVKFDLARWQRTYPNLPAPEARVLEGYETCIPIYNINPTPPTTLRPPTTTYTADGLRQSSTVFQINSIIPTSITPNTNTSNQHTYKPIPLNRNSHTNTSPSPSSTHYTNNNLNKRTKQTQQSSNNKQNTYKNRPTGEPNTPSVTNLTITAPNTNPAPLPAHTSPPTTTSIASLTTIPISHTTKSQAVTTPFTTTNTHSYSQVTAYNSIATATSQEERILKLEQSIIQMNARQDASILRQEEVNATQAIAAADTAQIKETMLNMYSFFQLPHMQKLIAIPPSSTPQLSLTDSSIHNVNNNSVTSTDAANSSNTQINE